MSALDRAFIKAHHKEPDPRTAQPEPRPTAETEQPAGQSGQADPAPANSPNVGAPDYHFHGAHTVRRGPHVPAGPAIPTPLNGDPALVGTDSAEPWSSPGDVAQPSAGPDDKPPAVPKPPLIFAGAEPELDADPTFAPDWEVDRLVWPPVCERLLESEQRYFRSVGQRLKDATQDSHHVVLITGARRGEGRTTLALCLARCAAQAGVAVALVDADLENPQLGTQLGMETPCGWLEVVTGKVPLSEAAVSSLEDGLTLFPLKQSEDQATPDNPSLRAVLRAIAVHFPLVIVDTGPIANDDPLPFASRGDCPIDTAIVVRDLRNTTEKKTLATARALQRRGVPAVGIAENFRDLN